MHFAHAPYASGTPPFTIGLAPIDESRWIEPDERLAEQLALKDAILAREPDAFGAIAGGEPGQGEVLDLLAAHLAACYPGLYRRAGGAMRIAANGRRVSLFGEPPLLTAARLVQEDLLLMQRRAEGWILVAGALCFPSTWRLADKLGRALDAIHAPVPGWAGPMAGRVARIFDRLAPGRLVERFNWSVYGDARLRHAEPRQSPAERFPPGDPTARAHVRVERQTLRRLPRSGDILFTVRVHVDPVAAFARAARGRELARALHDQLAALDPPQLAYKGLVEARGRLLDALAALSAPPAGPGADRVSINRPCAPI